jgi:AhpD family alkylhydroperoxidase
MARVRLLTSDEAPLLARGVYAEDGSASSLMRSLANAPDVLETLLPFVAFIYDEGAVDLRTKELAVVRVSKLNGCRYCLASHRPIALEAGVPARQVAAVCDEAPLDALPERERTIVEWVDRYVLDPSGIDDALVARVLDHLRDDQLIELSLLVGATQLLNHYCTAFDIPPPT